MTSEQLRSHLDRLGLSQMAFSRLTGRQPRTVRRWVCNEPGRGSPVPPEIAMLVVRLHPNDADVNRARGIDS